MFYLDSKVIENVQKISWIILPFLPLISISEGIKGYCEAFNIRKSFNYVPLSNLPIFLMTLWYFQRSMHLGIYGVIYSKILFIVVDLIGNIAVAYYYRTWIKFDSPQFYSELPKDFFKFGISALKNLQFQILNFFGITFCTLLALLSDHTRGQISFFYWINMQSAFYAIGYGYSQVIKRRLTFLVSKKEEYEAAKNFFFWFYRITLFFYMLLGGLLVILRYHIGLIYTTTDLIEEEMAQKIALGSFVYIAHILNFSLFETTKILDKQWVLLIVRGVIYLPIMCFLGIYFAYWTHYGVKGICFAYCFCEFIVAYSCTVFLIVYNWKYAFCTGEGGNSLKGSLIGK